MFNKRMISLYKTICLLIVLYLIGSWYATYRLPYATPESFGLVWQTCEITEFEYRDKANRELTEQCFGHKVEQISEEEKSRYAKFVGDQLQLQIASDIYSVTTSYWPSIGGRTTYTLYKNGEQIKRIRRNFVTYSPSISFTNLIGKTAWEVADGLSSTVFFDGYDLRYRYLLTRAYRPYQLADKVIFVGKRWDKFFVVYDGHRIGPDFDHITLGYCCEGWLYTVYFDQGRYLFRGRKDGKYFLAEISESSATDQSETI